MYYDGIITKPSLDELYHHGILGMKWGKRNGPPYPLKAGAHSSSEKQAGYKKSIGGGSESKESKLKKRQQKSLVYKKTYNKYTKSGMSEEDANYAAERKRKIAKILAISAGVTLTAIAATAAYKHFDAKGYISHTIKPGIKLQTLSMDAERGKLGDLYAAYKKSDKNQYKVRFGKDGQGTMLEQLGLSSDELKYNITNKIIKKTKIASPKASEKVFNKLMDSDSSFRNDVLKKLTEDGRAANYKNFNRSLVEHPEYDKKFYKALKDAGFGGLSDINDTKGLGMGLDAKAPIIIFDKSAYIQDSVKKLTKSEIKQASKSYANYQKMNELMNEAKGIGVASLSLVPAAVVIGNQQYDNKVIKENKKKSKVA